MQDNTCTLYSIYQLTPSTECSEYENRLARGILAIISIGSRCPNTGPSRWRIKSEVGNTLSHDATVSKHCRITRCKSEGSTLDELLLTNAMIAVSTSATDPPRDAIGGAGWSGCWRGPGRS
jgi:hypothetical protein